MLFLGVWSKREKHDSAGGKKGGSFTQCLIVIWLRTGIFGGKRDRVKEWVPLLSMTTAILSCWNISLATGLLVSAFGTFALQL